MSLFRIYNKCSIKHKTDLQHLLNFLTIYLCKRLVFLYIIFVKVFNEEKYNTHKMLLLFNNSKNSLIIYFLSELDTQCTIQYTRHTAK